MTIIMNTFSIQYTNDISPPTSSTTPQPLCHYPSSHCKGMMLLLICHRCRHCQCLPRFSPPRPRMFTLRWKVGKCFIDLSYEAAQHCWTLRWQRQVLFLLEKRCERLRTHTMQPSASLRVCLPLVTDNPRIRYHGTIAATKAAPRY